MVWIHHFTTVEGAEEESEFIVISENVNLQSADEEWGEEGYERISYELEYYGSSLIRLPLDRPLRGENTL